MLNETYKIRDIHLRIIGEDIKLLFQKSKKMCHVFLRSLAGMLKSVLYLYPMHRAR